MQIKAFISHKRHVKHDNLNKTNILFNLISVFYRLLVNY
jgi:hypothetical protein